MVKPGCTIRELLRHRKETGSFSEDIDQHCATLDAALAKSTITSALENTSDGRTIHTVSRPIADGGWVTTDEDITERISAQQERDRTRDLFNLLVENVPVTIFVKNASDRRFILVNRACEKDWGLPRSEILGKKGVRVVTSKAFVVRSTDYSNQYLVGVVEDVTDRKKSEERLRQAQKMETIGNLTGGLAHDFNNLLTVIIGNLDVLQELTADNAAQKKLVELVLEASLRGAELTQQLLAFSRRQPLHPKITNLDDLIEKTTRLLTPTLGENIRLELQLQSDVGSILVDEAQMEAALINMAVNARDAMPNGGTLTIKTGKLQVDGKGTSQPLGLVPGQYSVVEMNDTGDGMPPEVLARIFEPFFTTKAAGKGTALD